MKVISDGIVNGRIHNKYGKHGDTFNAHGVPTYSLPMEILDEPEGTKSFAFVLEDKDAVSISGGFTWIHWLGANVTKNKILENESQTTTDFVQGVNSWISMQGGNQSVALSSFYGGMAPPDTAHIYELHVYALDAILPLENGFMLNHMFRQMEGHILAQYTLKGEYPN